jgi:WD40 repeat protein
MFSPDGTRVVSASEDQTARVWDVATGTEILTLNHSDLVFDVAFSPDGSRIAVAGFPTNGTAKIWDATTGQELLNLPHNNDGAVALAFSPDGKILLTGSSDTIWRLWDTSTGAVLRVGYGHASLIEGVAFDPSGTRFATASEDGLAKVWDTATGRELVTLAGHASGLIGVAFSADGNRLFTVSRAYDVKVWDVSPTAGGEWLVLAGHTDRVMKSIYSPDGTLIATASVDNTVKIWDAVTGQEIRTLGGEFTDGIWDISFSPDGKRIVASTGIGNGIAKMWDVMKGQELLTLPTNGERMVFSPDGTRLVTPAYQFDTNRNISAPAQLRILDSSDGDEVLTIDTGIQAFFQSVVFSRDGKQIAISAEGGSIGVWDVETGNKILVFNSGLRSNKITFSPDGKWVVFSSNDSTIHIFEIATAKEIYTLTGHSGPTFAVTFSPDGKLLATSSVDRTVKIWNVEDGFTSLPLTLYGHSRAIYTVDFSPDGSRIVTASRDGTARVYAIAIEDLTKLAQSRLTRTLTLEECQQYLHVDVCP